MNGRAGLSRIVRAVVHAFVIMASPTALVAQVTLGVTVRSSDISAGTPGVCRYAVTRLVEQADPKAVGQLLRVSDSVVISVVDTAGNPVGTPAGLVVQVGAAQPFAVALGDTSETFAVGVREIAGRAVRVARTTEQNAPPLCVGTPFTAPTAARDIGVTHHDLFAGGEVSTALRTGSAAGTTGSLGLHTFSYRSKDRPYQFPFGWLPATRRRGLQQIVGFLTGPLSYPVALEELRATITVTGTGDTLYSPGRRQEFAQAVLAPLTSTRGTLSSVNIIYSPQGQYGQQSLRGFRLAAGATRSVWRGIIPASASNPVADTAARDTLAKDVTLFTGDVRWRWVLINHTNDNDGNVFSFAIDGGLTYRGIAGDITSHRSENESLRLATLGTTDRSFWGPVVGMYINLQRVMAFAELQNLNVSRDGAPVENLQGWQPLIGFRFEAPIFTIRPGR